MIMVKGCYIHIPFCKNICSYCDFCKNYYNEDVVKSYLKALRREINYNYKNEVLKTIYIGGGTPSCLSKKNLDFLFDIINIFNLSNDYEFTFECNYDDITENLLVFLKNNRVNRLSIGIQTFNEKYTKVLNRNINKNEMIEKIKLSKRYFENINIDLMYALPNQSLMELEEDLKELIELDVKHISTYALIIEKHTKLGLDNIEELDEDTQNKMYYKIADKLKVNGYNHYELSNFSKKGYESKHNLTYWKNEEYYGFGAGASGFVDGIRYDNTKSVINYINGKTRIYEEKMSFDQMIKDEVMLSLRKTDGININTFYEKYKVEFKKVFNYNKMIDQKLLSTKDNNLYIPYDKLFISNEIIIRLLDSYILND